jgi:hypothetical protein
MGSFCSCLNDRTVDSSDYLVSGPVSRPVKPSESKASKRSIIEKESNIASPPHPPLEIDTQAIKLKAAISMYFVRNKLIQTKVFTADVREAQPGIVRTHSSELVEVTEVPDYTNEQTRPILVKFSKFTFPPCAELEGDT